MITYPTDSDSPPRSAYQTEPWEDEATKTKWLYQPAANRWVPYVVSGGAELTSYVEQVASLDDYPSTFPPDTTGLALTARTDGVPDAIIPADAKTTPIDADETILRDSAVAGVPTKRLTFANLWAWIKSKASATFSDGEVMKWGSTADATLQNLGGGTAGRAVFGAASVGEARNILGKSELVVGEMGSAAGFTDNGDGTYSVNVTNNFRVAPWEVTGLVAGALYVVNCEYIEVTSGSLQFPGFHNGDPSATSINVGSIVAASGNIRSSLTVYGPNCQSYISIRVNNSFVGSIKKPTIFRIA
jgi:hypothetical protein